MKTDIAKMLEKPMKINDFSCFLYPILHQVDPKSLQDRPTWPQVGSSRPQVDRNLAEVGTKVAEVGLNIAVVGAKLASM